MTEWAGVSRREWATADARRRQDDYDVGALTAARGLVESATAQSGKDRWVTKGAATSRASSTTYTADPDLQFPVLEGTYYVMGRLLATSTSATPDIKVQISWPASSSLFGSYWSNAGTATVIAQDSSSPAITTNFDIAANGITLVQFDLMLVAGASGTFAVEWAQNTSDATATTLRAGSFVRYRQTV